MSSFKIESEVKKSKVVDIRCNPNKMHRLLIAYELQAVIVFSLNKNQTIFTIPVS